MESKFGYLGAWNSVILYGQRGAPGKSKQIDSVSTLRWLSIIRPESVVRLFYLFIAVNLLYSVHRRSWRKTSQSSVTKYSRPSRWVLEKDWSEGLVREDRRGSG